MNATQEKLTAAHTELARTKKLVGVAAAESLLVRELLARAEGREIEVQGAYFIALEASAIAQAEVDDESAQPTTNP